MKLMIGVVAAAMLAGSSAKAGTPADFSSSFGTVMCSGPMEVWFANPAQRNKPENRQITVMITEKTDGWDVTGSFGFHVKRWTQTRNTDGFPKGSVAWDHEGIWAHWTMMFSKDGEVVFEKYSPQGVEVGILKCEYARGPQ